MLAGMRTYCKHLPRREMRANMSTKTNRIRIKGDFDSAAKSTRKHLRYSASIWSAAIAVAAIGWILAGPGFPTLEAGFKKTKKYDPPTITCEGSTQHTISVKV